MEEKEDSMKPDDSGENAPDSSEHQEDIIFPLEEKRPPPPKKSFGFLKFIGLLVLIGGVFFLGYSSSPDSLEETKRKLQEMSSFVIEKSEPVVRKVVETLDAKIDKIGKKPPPGSPGGEKKTERKIKFWQGPMNPSYISDKPGKSPMGMDLIPVYEDENEGDGIRINPTMVQNIGVKTAVVRKKTLSRRIRTVGRLTYDERLVTHIHTKYEGWIEKLEVDFTGQEVEKDDLLMEIYSPELVSTQEELLLAMKYNQTLKNNSFTDVSRGAQNLLDSTRRRLELFDVPEHQIEELMNSKKITKTMHIHSPVRGFVIKKKALQGMYVKPGMSLYTIADLSNIWVLGDIYEYELPWVRIGQKVEMRLAYFPGKTFKGKVTFIDPFLDAVTRTVKVRMEFSNPKWELKPDMYADVFLKSIIARKTVVVPEEAVIHSGDKSIIVVKNKRGGFESREVKLGPQAEGYIQVIQGVKAGETVVTSANFLIDSESNLKEAINKMQDMKMEKGKKGASGSMKMPMSGKNGKGKGGMPGMKSASSMKKMEGSKTQGDMKMKTQKTPSKPMKSGMSMSADAEKTMQDMAGMKPAQTANSEMPMLEKTKKGEGSKGKPEMKSKM